MSQSSTKARNNSVSMNIEWKNILCQSTFCFEQLQTSKMGQFSFEVAFLIFFRSSFVITFEYCSNFEIQTNHSYYPLRHCQRANGIVIGLRNVKSFEDCVSFAKDRSALALNYRSNNKYNETTNRFDILQSKEMKDAPQEYYNCQLLECPEYGNFSRMVNDTRFDYYSLYTKPPRKCPLLMKISSKLTPNLSFSSIQLDLRPTSWHVCLLPETHKLHLRI